MVGTPYNIKAILLVETERIEGVLRLYPIV